MDFDTGMRPDYHEFTADELEARNDPVFAAYAVANGMIVPPYKDEEFSAWMLRERQEFFRGKYGVDIPLAERHADGHYRCARWSSLVNETAAEFESWVCARYPVPAMSGPAPR